jgi:dTDP-4-amino-4,6-dideoxygalactose transaminase
VFTTFEGGAVVCPDEKTRQRINYLKNFGFADEVTVVAPGINGKMSEFNAALGLLQLKGVDRAFAQRRAIDGRYRAGLADVRGIRCVPMAGETLSNHAYFPILVQPDYPLTRDSLYRKFRENGIFVRRYFYPLISEFPMYRGLASASQANLPVATKLAQQVLCLPIYPGLRNDQVDRILDLLSGKLAWSAK